MVKHDNIHRIEWPLGVITAMYPDEKGVIRTAEVEECGRRSLRPVSFVVPLELDCHHEDGEKRQCLRDDNQGNDDDVTATVDSISEAGDRSSPSTSAGTQERSIPHDASSTESTSHHTSGSSRESGSANGTMSSCNINDVGSLNTHSPSPPPYLPVPNQTSWGEERDAGMGEPATQRRQPRRAAQRQQDLLKKLIHEDQIQAHLPFEVVRSSRSVGHTGGSNLYVIHLFNEVFISLFLCVCFTRQISAKLSTQLVFRDSGQQC